MNRTDGAAVELVFEEGAGAEDRLAGELLALAGVDADTALASDEGDTDDAEHGEADEADALGTVVARRGGALAGWATLLEPDEVDDGHPVLQWALASFEAELIATGDAPDRAATDEELGVLEALVRAAADAARERGHGALLWSPSLYEADARLAERLGAVVHREEGRDWSVDLEGYAVPDGLPRVRVRQVEEEVGDERLDVYAKLYAAHAILHPFPEEWDRADVEEWLDTGHLGADWLQSAPTFDLLGDAGGDAPVVAQLTALVDAGGTASVGKVIHHGVDAPRLAAALAESAVRLARHAPPARVLTVREFDDATVADACAAAGLDIAVRWPLYRLDL